MAELEGAGDLRLPIQFIPQIILRIAPDDSRNFREILL